MPRASSSSLRIGHFVTFEVSAFADGTFSVLTGWYDDDGWMKDARVSYPDADAVRRAFQENNPDQDDAETLNAWLAEHADG